MIFLDGNLPPSLFKYLVILFIGGLILWRISLALKSFSFQGAEASKKKKRWEQSPMRKFIESSHLSYYELKENRWNSPLFAATSMRIKAMAWLFILSIIGAIFWRIFKENNVLAVFFFGTMMAFIINAFIVFKTIFQYYFAPDFKYILNGLYYRGGGDSITKAIHNFKKAIEIKPREFTYSQLAVITFRRESFKANQSEVFVNHDESIELYKKAIEVSAYDINVPLKELVSSLYFDFDYEGALDKFELYKEIYVSDKKRQTFLYRSFFYSEKRKMQDNHNYIYALTGMDFYYHWTKSLFIIGDYDNAFNKINIAIDSVKIVEAGRDLSYLYELRGEINFRLKDFEQSKQDYAQSLLKWINYRVSQGYDFDGRESGLKNLMENIELPFKASTDPEGLVKLYEKCLEKVNRESGANIFFSEKLVLLLKETGEIERAIKQDLKGRVRVIKNHQDQRSNEELLYDCSSRILPSDIDTSTKEFLLNLLRRGNFIELNEALENCGTNQELKYYRFALISYCYEKWDFPSGVIIFKSHLFKKSSDASYFFIANLMTIGEFEEAYNVLLELKEYIEVLNNTEALCKFRDMKTLIWCLKANFKYEEAIQILSKFIEAVEVAKAIEAKRKISDDKDTPSSYSYDTKKYYPPLYFYEAEEEVKNLKRDLLIYTKMS